MRLLGKAEIEDIVWGSALLGAGGGGSPYDGLNLVKEMENEIVLLDPADLPESANAVMVAGIGAPRAMSEKGFLSMYSAISSGVAVPAVTLFSISLSSLKASSTAL